jgi:hypothetical protein
MDWRNVSRIMSRKENNSVIENPGIPIQEDRAWSRPFSWDTPRKISMRPDEMPGEGGERLRYSMILFA